MKKMTVNEMRKVNGGRRLGPSKEVIILDALIEIGTRIGSIKF